MEVSECARCHANTRPLLLRIDQLEGKLLCEVERREHEYNELLHLLLTIKRSTTNHSLLSFTRPLAARTLPTPTPDPHNKPKKKEILTAKRKTAPSQERTDKSSPKATIGKTALQQRMEQMERITKEHQVQLTKGKELNEYLMEQLLGIYQKIGQLEATTSQKELSSLETIPSLLIEPIHKQQLRAFSQSIEENPQLQYALTDSQSQMRSITKKLSEHQSVLSELIGLTRVLSARMADPSQLTVATK